VPFARPGGVSHPLAEAVFASVYGSREQRSLRGLALTILILQHTVRGLLFSWPLYLMTTAGFLIDSPVRWWLWTLGVPGIGISLYVLARGARADYRAHVKDRLMVHGALMRILRGSKEDPAS